MIPVMIVGGVFCFLTFEYINYEETDEYLTFEMGRYIVHHNKNNVLSEAYHFAYLIPGKNYLKPVFKDTVLFEPGDNEMIPYRELHFSITHDGKVYGVALRHLLLPYEVVAKGTVTIVIGLLLLIAFIIFIIMNQVTRKIWKPFYAALDNLVNFKIEHSLPVFSATDIDEFKALNTTLSSLLKKVTDDYRHNKEFNENASHELQTHLAVIRASAEKLLNSPNTAGEQRINELQKIYSASSHLSQVQKSLLLLSKINNREFYNNVDLDLCIVIKQSLEIFTEAANLRGIEIRLKLEPVIIFIDSGLAEILVNNLIKNAVKYNVENGFIDIALNSSALIIKNSGLPYAGDPNTLFERFVHGETGNLGIGLAIVREICELYHYSISYTISGQTEHALNIKF
jgi:signal transduction histidine kinase